MAKNKTVETSEDVRSFLVAFSNSEQKLQDSYRLLELMQEVSGFKPKMWGPSIVGFGKYHYKYDSGHEGDAPLIGFSPRKAALSIYVFTGLKEHEYLLKDLGKFKMGKACIYANKLADINEKNLMTLMKKTIQYLQSKYPEN